MSYKRMCYVHNGPYVGEDREKGCQHPECVELRSNPVELSTMWNLTWLKESNKAGTTANEMRQEIYEGAKAEGRDITRAK